MSAEIVRLVPRQKLSRSEQRTSYRISMEMFTLLKDVEGMEDHGGWPVVAGRSYKAVKRRGLVAEYSYRQEDTRACLSPMGRRAIRLFQL
jgi:hypothetical protein